MVNELAGKQQADGGWTLDSLGPWSKHADAPPAEGSNAYATGLVAFVLERAGVSAANPNLGGALQWLRAHQDKLGFWEAAPGLRTEPKWILGIAIDEHAL